MNRSVEKYLKTFGIAILALVVASIATGYAPLVIKTSAQAVSITFNGRASENLNPGKVIEILITGNFGNADQIEIRVVDAATKNQVPVGVPATCSSQQFRASRVPASTNLYVAYLGGPLADINNNPQNPKIPRGTVGNINYDCSYATIDSTAFQNLAQAGGSVLIYIVPTNQYSSDITQPGSIIIAPVVPVVTITPKFVPYRRDAVITVYLVDQDLNKDPTRTDQYSGSDLANIEVRITVLRSTGQIGPLTTSLDKIATSALTETEVSSGNFTFTTSIKTLNTEITRLLTTLANSPQPFLLRDGDRVILAFRGLHRIQGDPNDQFGTLFDDPARGSDFFNAIYRQPSVSVSATQYSVTITIDSPDDNIDPTLRDSLDVGGILRDPVTVGAITVPGVNLPPARLQVILRNAQGIVIAMDDVSVDQIYNPALGLFGVIETGVNTGRFTTSLTVYWSDNAFAGPSSPVNIPKGAAPTLLGRIVLQTGYRGPFIIEARYYTPPGSRPDGYGVDAIGRGVYTPQLANLSVVKATLKIWNITVEDRDLNTRSGTLEILTPSYDGPANLARFRFTRTEATALGFDKATVAIVEITDENGNTIYTDGSLASQVITLSEPDFNVNTFILKIDASRLCTALPCAQNKIQPGQTFFIRYTDLTGFDTTTGRVVLKVDVAPIKIVLDRSVYPINITDGVVVYIRYINDILNTRFDQIEYASATITLYDANGQQLPNSPACPNPVTVLLRETSADSGEFVSVNPVTGTYGGIRIPAKCFTPSMIGGKIVVVSLDDYQAKAEARFQPFSANIRVNTTVVRYGDYVQVIVEHPDANTDSNATETITVNMTTIHGLSKKITLVEDGTNSSRFVGVIMISWDDPEQEGKVYPNDVIFFKYDDLTPPGTLPTASAWLPETKTAQVTVASTYGEIRPTTAAPNAVGLFEEFNVYVFDPDLNRYMLRVDKPPIDEGYVYISTTRPDTGAPVIGDYVGLVETDVNTGNFTAITRLSLVKLLLDKGVILQSDVQNPFRLAQSLAQYVGRTINITYGDVYNPDRNVRLVTKSLVIRAFNPSITTNPSDFVELGQVLTITVINPTVAGTTIADYRSVIVRNDNRNFIRQFYMEEIAPGVFQVNLTVVESTQWTGQPGSTDIPAKRGDIINITYVAPVTEDGRVYVPFSKAVTVGKFLERPFDVPSISLTLQNGTPVTTVRTGQTVQISFSLSNSDEVTRVTTVIVIVRDSRGVSVFTFFITLPVPAGSTVTLGPSWTPFAPGNYTIEIRVVKGLTDLSPQSVKDIYTLNVTVTGS